MIMEEWSARWLRMQRIKPRTRESYESLLRLYILPTLGTVKLAELSAEAIQVAIAAPLAAGHGRTAGQVYTLLVQICRAAVRAGHMERSPMDAILRPFHVPTPTAWWAPEDAARFLRLRELALDPHLVVWALALTCGLRRGELCGLQWQDIDLGQCTITVARQRITLADGRTVAAPPKSRSSARTLAIPADLSAWLADHPIRLLTKDYFHRHPVKAFSAARLAYSMLLMPEVVTCLEDKLPELREMTAMRGVQLPDSAQQKVLVEQEEDAGQLLRMLRRPLARCLRRAAQKIAETGSGNVAGNPAHDSENA